MVTETELFQFTGITPFDFCLWGWMQSEVYKRDVDTPDELLSDILDAAACIKKRKYQLRRTTRDLRTGIAKCTEFDDGIFEYLLCKINSNFSFFIAYFHCICVCTFK
jgi:hypothetical protein